MNSADPPDTPGPVEAGPWPDHLDAHAWTAGPRPALHGYDLLGDLSQHYGFAELVLTSLCGQAPSRAHGQLFGAVLVLLSPCDAGQAPAHVAVLARTLRARWPALVSSGAAALAEQAASVLSEHHAMLAWLDDPRGPFPSAHHASSEDDRAVVRALQMHVQPSGQAVPALAHDPSPMAALLAVAHHCGLRDAERLVSMIVIARLPAVLAEGLRRPGDLRGYPMNTPRFDYDPPAEPDA